MKITKIKISNHQRVADLDIDVRDHAVLVGPNAVGKSTVLRLLDGLLGASCSQIVASLDPTQLKDVSEKMIVEVRLEGLDADDIASFSDKVEVGTDEAVGSVWLTMRLVAGVSPIDPERLDIDRSFVKPLVDDAAVSRDDLRQIGWAFLPASRSPDRDLGTGRTSAVRSLLRAVLQDPTEAKAIEDALADLSAALKSSPALATLRHELATELSGLFPEPIDKDEIVVDLPPSTTDEPLNDVDVRLDRGGV